MTAQQLLVATRNSHKTAEIRQIISEGARMENFADYLVEDLNLRSDWPDIEETADTFLGNALLKAVGISKVYKGLVLADDSGLEVDALEGAPGVRSARFAGETATDQENRTLLLHRLARIREKDRTGRFRCAMVLAKNGRVLGEFDGAVEGLVIDAEQGDHGFGYDSLFVPEGYCQTFAQLSSDTKNRLSHRAQAMKKVRLFLKTQAFV